MSGLLRLPLSRVVLLDSSPCSIDGKEQALFPQSSLTSTQGYPLNFLCSPPALNERLGRRRSSASSLSQNSLYVNDGRPFWQYIVSSSTGCSDSQCFEELYNYYTTDKAWHLCDPDAEKVVEALRKAGVKVAVVSNFDTRLRPLLHDLCFVYGGLFSLVIRCLICCFHVTSFDLLGEHFVILLFGTMLLLNHVCFFRWQ